MQTSISILLSLFLLPQTVLAKPKITELIPNFQTVHTGRLYRGGTPGIEGVKKLKALGVKTIVSLESDDKTLESERKAALAAGMNWFSIPMNALVEPEDWEVDSALAILSNPAMQPAFVHCAHGRDRTGLIVGLYRVEKDGWTPAHAYEEMKRLGFRAILWGVRRKFEKRTGFNI